MRPRYPTGLAAQEERFHREALLLARLRMDLVAGDHGGRIAAERITGYLASWRAELDKRHLQRIMGWGSW